MRETDSVEHLDTAPRLTPLLLGGALRAPRKRGPFEAARLPARRLELGGARADSAALRRYAEVCGFPAGAEVLPPTYPHLLGFPLQMRLMSAADFPFPLPGLVHTGIEVHQHARLATSDALDVAAWAEGPEPHRRGSVFTMATEARRGGEVVWESRSRYLCRHRTAAAGERGEREPDEELPVRAEWRLGGDLGRRYGAASGDRNPIHLSAPTARLFGFPRAIAHGMWSFARCLAGSEVQQAWARGEAGEHLDADAEFKAPVLLPATVRFAEREAGTDAAALALRDAEDGRLHLSGSVSSARPSPAPRGPSN